MQTTDLELAAQVMPFLEQGSNDRSAIAEAAMNLITRYQEPWRHYHTLSHLQTMTRYLIERADELDDPRTVLWAALGHDSIYHPELYLVPNTSGLNEKRSADLTEHLVIPITGMQTARKIGDYIRSTANHTGNNDPDLDYLLDADLLILGSSPEEFEAYDSAIRQEFHFVDTALYRSSRAGALKSLGDQTIFRTAEASARYEAQALSNIGSKISELSAQH